MLTIRQSLIEKYRQVCQTEWSTEEELVQAVMGQWPGNEKTSAGTAWHHLLASFTDEGRGQDIPEPCRNGDSWQVCVKDGNHNWWFDCDAAEQAAALVGPGLVELPGGRLFNVVTSRGSKMVMVTGTCDHISGKLIQDHKTTFSTPDPRNYESSLQWRIYALLFDADCFRYNLWHFADPTEQGYCRYKEVVRFNFWRYHDMEKDVQTWLTRLVEWLVVRELEKFLEIA